VAGVACLTWAVVTEFTAAPVAAAVAMYGSRKKMISAGDNRVMLGGCALITGFVFLLPLPIYNHLAFGAPWRLSYQSVTGFPGAKLGFFGIQLPQLKVLYQIIFGARRGIIPLCPLLLLIPLGVIQMSRDGQRRLAVLIVVVVMYYLALNSSYYYWDGGWSTGPRHITGMLPFACLPLGSVWNYASRGMRAFVLLLVSVSLALAVDSASTGMFAPTNIDDLLFDYLIPGDSRAVLPVYLFGWRFRYFLLGLFSVWVCLGLMIARQFARPGEGHAAGGIL